MDVKFKLYKAERINDFLMNSFYCFLLMKTMLLDKVYKQYKLTRKKKKKQFLDFGIINNLRITDTHCHVLFENQ